jgi:hypothetical protein
MKNPQRLFPQVKAALLGASQAAKLENRSDILYEWCVRFPRNTDHGGNKKE